MTGGRRRVVKGAVAAIALSVLAGFRVKAQEEPIIIGQREQLKKFHLEPPRYDLTLLAQYAVDEQDSLEGNTEVTELRFEETLGLKTRGHIIHPNIVDFKFDGLFGLSQAEFEFNEGSERVNGTIYEFDFNADILRREETHYSLYARRTRDLINQQFAPSLDSTTTTYGATVETLVKNINMRLDAYRLESTQSALGDRDFTFEQNTIQWNGWMRPTPHQRLTGEYRYEGTQQTSSAFEVDTAYDTHEVDVEHVWKLGARRAHELTSEFNYFNQTGDFALERALLTERLRMQHTDRFRTDYLYRFQQQSRDEFDQDQHLLEARLEHRLYRSLITNARVGANQFSTSEGGDTLEFYGDAELEYEKIVPLGLLTLDFGVNFAQLEADAHGGGIQIVDATASFQDPVPIIIFGQNIDPTSIVITSPTGLLYVRGEDYLVNSAFTDRVEITRVPTGRILNGQAVLIDYELGPAEASTSTTTGFSTGGRYAFEQGPLKGLALFARYSVQQQDITPEGSAVPVSDFTDILYGAEYEFWSLRFRAEQQRHDAEIVPFDATRFLARLAHRMSETTITADTIYSVIDYEDPANRVELWTASGTVFHKLSRELSASLSAVWRDQTDDLSGHTQGFEQQLDLSWKHRQTEVFILFRNATFDSEDLDNSFQLFQIGIRREF